MVQGTKLHRNRAKSCCFLNPLSFPHSQHLANAIQETLEVQDNMRPKPGTLLPDLTDDPLEGCGVGRDLPGQGAIHLPDCNPGLNRRLTQRLSHRNAVMPIADKIQIPNLDQAYRWELLARPASCENAQPAFPGAFLQRAKVAVEIKTAALTAPDLADGHRANPAVILGGNTAGRADIF
jgi:hypothetical protein